MKKFLLVLLVVGLLVLVVWVVQRENRPTTVGDWEHALAEKR